MQGVSGTAGLRFKPPPKPTRPESGEVVCPNSPVTTTAEHLRTAIGIPPPERPAGASLHLNITPDFFFLLAGYDSLNGPVAAAISRPGDMLGEHNFSLLPICPGYQSRPRRITFCCHGPLDVDFSFFYVNTTYPYYSSFLPVQCYPLSTTSRLAVGIGFPIPLRALPGLNGA